MKKPDDFDFLEAVSPSVQWLRESMDINQGQGSSAYFSRFRHPIKGWSPAYPETTGYLIPTLLTYSKISGFEDLKEYSGTLPQMVVGHSESQWLVSCIVCKQSKIFGF
ncbi:MAG: hypothetical protein R2879_14780 [Saprospiraceae bacterium]